MLYSPQAVSVANLRARTSLIFRILLVALLIAIALSLPLQAQNITATVLGTVKDPSGSAVAGANITLANTGTGATRSTKTDGNGDFLFSAVEVGSYTLTAEASGFQRQQFSQF